MKLEDLHDTVDGNQKSGVRQFDMVYIHIHIPIIYQVFIIWYISSGNRYLWDFCLPSTSYQNPHQPGKPTTFRNGFLKSIFFDKLATMPVTAGSTRDHGRLIRSTTLGVEVTEKKTPLERGSIRKLISTRSTFSPTKRSQSRKYCQFSKPVFGKGVRQQYKATQPTNQQTTSIPRFWCPRSVGDFNFNFEATPCNDNPPTMTGGTWRIIPFSKW